MSGSPPEYPPAASSAVTPAFAPLLALTSEASPRSAETNAVAKIANEGWIGELSEVAIIGGRPHGDDLIGSDPVNPCGRCRQILNEAAERSKADILVHCASGDGLAVKSSRLSELLPAAFGPKDLGLID